MTSRFLSKQIQRIMFILHSQMFIHIYNCKWFFETQENMCFSQIAVFYKQINVYSHYTNTKVLFINISVSFFRDRPTSRNKLTTKYGFKQAVRFINKYACVKQNTIYIISFTVLS